jgi:hypothetical protein
MKTLLLLAVVLTAASAEEMQLLPVGRPSFSSDQKCGPYFIVSTFGGTMRPLTLFSYRALDGSAKGSSVPTSQAIPKISESQTVPTYEEVVVDFQTKAIFRMNPDQYNEARACLQPPQK